MNEGKRRIGWISGVMGALMLVALTPATASAAPLIRFNVALGSECVTGYAARNATAWITWKDSSGGLKQRSQITTTSNGYWYLCVSGATTRTGDTIKVNDGIHVRTLTVPVLTLVIDRANDSLRGMGPANAYGAVYWHAGLYADFYEFAEVMSDAIGAWSLTPEEDEDLIGGIDGSVQWETSIGDSFTAYGMAPFIEVTLGRSTFTGGAQPGKSTTFKLRDTATATLKGIDSVAADTYGYFGGQFLDAHGQPSTVLPGDRVLSKAASDLNWIVPNVEATADVANDFVNGRCYSTDLAAVGVRVDIYRTGVQRGLALGGLDQDGGFSIDFDDPPDLMYDPANIKHGDRVVTSCMYETGDHVQLIVRVP